jgi:hypothetical protein
MSSGSSSTQKGQLNQDNAWAGSSLDKYNSGISDYGSNVNATLGAGNPYESKQFLTNQNLQTSGAMNSANTRQQQQMRDVVSRTGTNTAGVGESLASSARQGQRDMTQFNATRDNQNQDKWLQQQQQLYGDQLAGANSQAGVYGQQMSGASNALNNVTQRQDAQDQMWGGIAQSAVGAAGAAAAA